MIANFFNTLLSNWFSIKEREGKFWKIPNSIVLEISLGKLEGMNYFSKRRSSLPREISNNLEFSKIFPPSPLDRESISQREIPFPGGKWRLCEMKTDKLRDGRLIGTRYRVSGESEGSICGARVDTWRQARSARYFTVLVWREFACIKILVERFVELNLIKLEGKDDLTNVNKIIKRWEIMNGISLNGDFAAI